MLQISMEPQSVIALTREQVVATLSLLGWVARGNQAMMWILWPSLTRPGI